MRSKGRPRESSNKGVTPNGIGRTAVLPHPRRSGRFRRIGAPRHMPFRIADLEPAKWILNGVLPLQPRRAPDWSGNIVANCLPDVFPSYAKVLHAIWEDTSVNDRTTSWQDVRGDDALDKIASFAVEPEAVRDLFKDSVTVRGRTADEGKLRRFRWSSLAERYGIIFNPSINDNSVTSRFPGRSWPRYLVGPDEGTLDEESVLCLCDLFWHFTGNQECYFMYDLIGNQYIRGQPFVSGWARPTSCRYG